MSDPAPPSSISDSALLRAEVCGEQSGPNRNVQASLLLSDGVTPLLLTDGVTALQREA
jgi:hypothetical protein